MAYSSNGIYKLSFDGVDYAPQYANCNISGYYNGQLDWYGNGWPYAAFLGEGKLNPGNYLLNLNCLSLDNIYTYSTASFAVYPSAGDIEIAWNVIPYYGATNNVQPSPDYDYASVNYASQFYLSYTSNTDACDLVVFEGEDWDILRPWYAHYGFRPSFDWGGVYLTPKKYRYDLSCRKQNYQLSKRSLRLEIIY